MAEESGQERSLPATPRRIEKAREEGKVARSPELATTIVLGSGGLVLWWFGGQFVERLQSLLGAGLRFYPHEAYDPVAMTSRALTHAIEALQISLPLLAILVIAAVASPLLLGGWMFSWQALRFDVNRLGILSGLGRIFSGHGAAELGKAVGKALLLTSVLGFLLWHFHPEAAALGSNEPKAGLASTGRMLMLAFLVLAMSMALMAAIDVPLQLWRHHAGLKMTMQEMREETRESEGDPLIRAQIRSRQREMARRRMMSEVPRADVVVTNPTHYSVALQYREDRMRAPVVVAKGSGPVALRIREIAAEHGVPRLEAPSLARALHRHAEIGEEVPAALYGAVAQVLAYVFQLRQHGGANINPPLPEDIAVPADLDPGEMRT